MAKRKRLAAKRKTSRQKEKDSRQNFFQYREDILILISFAVRSWLFFLPWGYSFCRKVFLFAVRLIFLPWQLWATVPLKFSDSWYFNRWVFVMTSTNFAHFTSFQAIEFISVCQTSENKAFKMQHSVTFCCLISSPVSTFSARTPSTMPTITMWEEMKVRVPRIYWEIRLKDDK